MAVTNFRSLSPNANHLLWQTRLTQENTTYSSPRAKALTPELRAAARQLLRESPLSGYPGYRPNSQMRRCHQHCSAELKALHGVRKRPPVEQRIEELPSFVAQVRGQLQAELRRLRRVR